MPVEFETKFILKNDVELLDKLSKSKYAKQEILQIYTTKHNRFRAIAKHNKAKVSTKYVHTFKKDIEGEVLELEHFITAEDFKLIEKANNIATLRKLRFTIPQENGVWDIDFLLLPDNSVYFACAECEQPKGLKISIPKVLKPYIHYQVLHEYNSVFSNFKLSNLDYARDVIHYNSSYLMLY